MIRENNIADMLNDNGQRGENKTELFSDRQKSTVEKRRMQALLASAVLRNRSVSEHNKPI